MKTRAVRLNSAQFSMVLPGTWAVVPLDDEANAQRMIAALVKRQVGLDDRLAKTRRELREQLLDVVRKARASSAFQLALSLEILPGVPFPASMILDERDWLGGVPVPENRAAQLQSQAHGLELLDLESGLAARSWQQVNIQPGEEVIADTKLEYFLPTHGGDRVLHIVADAPVECDPEMIVALFDTMVDSIRWQEQSVSAEELDVERV